MLKVILLNEEFNNMDIEDFYINNNKKLKIEFIERNGIKIQNSSIKLQLGDILELSGRYIDLFETIQKLGVPPLDNSLWNTITIYQRVD